MFIKLGRVGVWSHSALWEEDGSGAAAAELAGLGFDTLWLGAADGDLRLAGELLDATDGLVLATGIVNIWLTPADALAAEFGRIVSAYPDRFLLGIGAGHKQIVEPLTGQHYARPYSTMVSYLDELDAAGVPAAGRVIAALGPKMLDLAARRAAGAHPYLVTPDFTRRARGALGEGPLLAVEQTVLLETDPEQARATARAALELYLTLPHYTNSWLRMGFTEDDLAGGGSDRLVDGIIAWGDADAIAARVAEHHRAGADHVCIQMLSDGYEHPRAAFRTLAGALFG